MNIKKQLKNFNNIYINIWGGVGMFILGIGLGQLFTYLDYIRYGNFIIPVFLAMIRSIEIILIMILILFLIIIYKMVAKNGR